jgi:PST family polysaccharide transporter
MHPDTGDDGSSGTPDPPVPRADLRQRTLVAGSVVFAVRSLQAVLLLGSSVLLARLLSPDEFGVFAMVVPLGVMVSGLTNHAVQTALLQQRELPAPRVDRFFRLVAGVATVAALAMGLAGLGLARLFGEPRVVGVTAAWAALTLLLVPATFQEALLKRDLLFPRVLLVQLASMTLGIACALVAARGGAGHWALAIQVLVMEGGRAAGIFILSAWRPTLRSRARTAGGDDPGLRRAWLSLVGLRASTWLGDLPDLVAVGRLETTFMLGNYDTARRWARYAFEESFLSLTDVAVAGLRPLQDEAEPFRRAVRRAVLAMLTVSLPLVAFVAVEAESVVLVVLGSQWVGAIPLLRILSVAAFFTGLAQVGRWVYLARGRTGRLVAWSLLVHAPVMLAAVLAGMGGGARGIAIAITIGSGLLIVPALWYSVIDTPLSLRDMLGAVARPTLASGGAAAFLLLAVDRLPAGPGALHLTVAAAAFAGAFLLAWHAMPGGLADTRQLAAAMREMRR